MREKMVRVLAHRERTAKEKAEAEKRKKYGGLGNSMKPELARLLNNDLKRLNTEITQEAFYRETGSSGMKIANTTAYKFTFDAKGNVLLTKKAPLAHSKHIVPEDKLDFEVKQGVVAAPLEKQNLEALGTNDPMIIDLDTSDRHSTRLKTLTFNSKPHSVKKGSVLLSDRKKKH